MSSQFSSRTGLPMIDLFFNSFATMIEMQRAFASGSLLMAPMGMNFGRSQPSRPVGIGAAEQQVIPIPKEELRIGKRQVPSTKAYRVSTTVVEVPVEEQVNLRAETVVIERRPTTGTTVRGGESFQNHTIEVHEMYEEPVIGKVVTQAEEMVIYKVLSERTATVRETVRQTRVNVEEHATLHGRPRTETARESGVKAEEQAKAPIHPPVEAAAGFRVAAAEKSHELVAAHNHDDHKSHAGHDAPQKHDDHKSQTGHDAHPKHDDHKNHAHPGGDTKPRGNQSGHGGHRS